LASPSERAPKGEVVIFNRSHFVDVLVGRIHKLVEKSVWSKRYDLINELISTQENQMSFAGNLKRQQDNAVLFEGLTY
jgi:polyphosphate kinase 2 (PPK2 family)